MTMFRGNKTGKEEPKEGEKTEWERGVEKGAGRERKKKVAG